MKDFPCFTCTERTQRCHASCERYLTAKADARKAIEWLSEKNRRSFDSERVTFRIIARRRYDK